MSNRSLLSASAIALVAMAPLAPLAKASVNVQSFAPAANSTYMMTEDAMMQIAPKDATWNGRNLFFSANYSWVNDPLVELNSNRTDQTAILVDGINTLDLTTGWFVNRRLSLNLGVPLNLVHVPGRSNQFALGDSRFFMKYRLTHDRALLAVSMIPEIFVPTGASDLFLSNGSVGTGLKFAFERDFGSIRAAANLGYVYHSDARYRDLNYSQKLPMSLGAFVPLGSRWGLNGEATGALTLPLDRFNNPGEFYAGTRYQISRDAALTGGGSIGSAGGNGANDMRFIIGLKLSPMPDAPVVPSVQVQPPTPIHAVAAAPVRVSPRVVFTPKEIKITEEIKFQHAKAALTASGKLLLDEVAEVIKVNKDHCKKIVIEGHANEIGTYYYNQVLSEQRAASVKEYLVGRGISAELLGTVGFGKTRPKYLPDLPKEVQLQANRRVQFKVSN